MTNRSIRTKHKIVAAVEADLLKRVRKQEGISRVELARQLNLAPSTAGIYVDRLIREGLLVEGQRVHRKYGRQPTPLSPNPAAGRFVGVDFEAQSVMTIVVDFSSRELSRSQRAIPKGDSVERVLRRIEDFIEEAIGRDRGGPLLGIGVGVPGIIDAIHGGVSGYEFIPGWKDVPVGARLAARFGVPINVENNVRSMAMAEMLLGQGRGLRNFMCLGIRTGISAATVINGELLTGAHGGAGEIGSWPALFPTSSGGLASEQSLERGASLSMILASASGALGKKLDLEGLRVAVHDGNPKVLSVLFQAAAAHGVAIRQLHVLFDPERIIIVGPLSDLGAAYVTPLTLAVGNRFDGPAPVIVHSTFGQFGGALGAAVLALHHWKPQR